MVVVICDGVVVFSCVVHFNIVVKILLGLTCYTTCCVVVVHHFYKMRGYVWCPSLDFLISIAPTCEIAVSTVSSLVLSF